jgi:gliding-associated putative ABC transporter substrate-binding component GldG
LLEGSFTSLYANRLPPSTQEKFKFREKGLPGAVLVVGDGDVPLNEYSVQKKMVYPLGYDRITGITFGNKDFILNTLSYMLDTDGLIMARQKQVTLRPLDKLRLEKEKAVWQTANVAGPLVLLLLFAGGRAWVRKRKYGK